MSENQSTSTPHEGNNPARIRDLPGWKQARAAATSAYTRIGATERLAALEAIGDNDPKGLTAIDPRTLNDIVRRVVGDNPLPGDHGINYADEAAVLNAPTVGNQTNLGDLILSVIAPGIMTDTDRHPEAWEPPEGAYMRQLALELEALGEGIEQNMHDHIELPNMIRNIAERTEAARSLAYRLRLARFGTSPTYGGVLAKDATTADDEPEQDVPPVAAELHEMADAADQGLDPTPEALRDLAGRVAGGSDEPDDPEDGSLLLSPNTLHEIHNCLRGIEREVRVMLDQSGTDLTRLRSIASDLTVIEGHVDADFGGHATAESEVQS